MTAQADFVPLTLRDVKLEKSDTSWNDIGGMVLELSLVSDTPDPYSIIRALRNATNPARDVGMANEIWAYICSVSIAIALGVRPVGVLRSVLH